MSEIENKAPVTIQELIVSSLAQTDASSGSIIGVRSCILMLS
jgi:hypothetical protein